MAIILAHIQTGTSYIQIQSITAVPNCSLFIAMKLKAKYRL
jgi:hypothetical protein